ncbi:MAG: putative glycolipid-binding domain-containing protein [Actinomycetota bacterium]|nr:putative glycolipid-binding domain-containing protein [Actinomycetota bacterium]
MRRLLIWSGIDTWRAEAATVELRPGGLWAEGTQLGAQPVAYRLDYWLEVGGDWLTRGLHVRARGVDWMRELDLRHDGHGGWTAQASQEGDVQLPPPGGDVAAVHGALDCDLGLCPLTNVMPVRRHELHLRPGEMDFLMAWVSVPDLGLHPSRQRYEHVGRRDERRVVRYVGEHRSFVAELELDHDGFVMLYPQLARRLC